MREDEDGTFDTAGASVEDLREHRGGERFESDGAGTQRVWFPGPNGAGKSTTIRMILGLQRPSRGTITLFGRAVPDRATLGRVGSLVESPSLYLHLTGRENLEVHRRAARHPETGDRRSAGDCRAPIRG